MMKDARLFSVDNIPGEANSLMSSRKIVCIILIGAFLICGLTFIVYFPSTENGFVNWDDDTYVDNSYLGKPILEFMRSVFTSFIQGNWQPTTMLSLKLDHFFYGMNAYGFHLTNILFHAVNTFLVVCFVGYLFYKSANRLTFSHFMTIFFIGIVFGLHPMHVESVTWISERKDVLYAFFWLSGLLAYMGYISNSKRKTKYSYYILCLGCFLLSLSSKAMAVTFPVVLLILDYYFTRLTKENFVKVFILEKIPFYVLQIVFVAVTVVSQSQAGAIATLAIKVRLLRAMRGLAFYLVKFLFPVRLSPLYLVDYQKPWWNWEYLASITLLIGFTVIVLLSIKRTRIFVSLWLYYLITLSPVLGIIQIGTQAAADRYMYLALLGPLVALALGVKYAFFDRGKNLPVAVFVITITAVLSLLTVKQIKIWKDSFTLWTRATSLSSEFAYPSNLLATTHFSAGNLDKAIETYKQSLKKKYSSVKFDANAYYNLGLIYYRKKMYAEALSNLSRSLMLRPDNADAYNTIGVIFFDNKDVDNAIRYYNLALKHDANYSAAYFNLGEAYATKGTDGKAAENFNVFIDKSANSYEAHIEVAQVYQDVKLIGKALEHYKMALAFKPDSELVKEKVYELENPLR